MWTRENRGLYERKGLRYPSDLRDEEWAYPGRPSWVDSRLSGCRAQAPRGDPLPGAGPGDFPAVDQGRPEGQGDRLPHLGHGNRRRGQRRRVPQQVFKK